MNVFLKRFFAVLLAVLMTSAVLTSCAADTSAPVLKYELTEVTENMYTYWTSAYKSYYLKMLGGEDTDAFLTSAFTVQNDRGELEETTVGDYLGARIREIIESNCISLYLFDYYKLTLPASTTSSVNEIVNAEIENAGGRKALNEALAPIGLNTDMLREMYLADEKIAYVYDYLYGDTSTGTSGAEPISTAQYNAFYEENYVCVRHIYIRTADKNIVDAEGNATFDENGNVITAELTAEEAAQKLALCDDLMARLNAGEDFLALEEEFSEDAGRYTLTEGYILSRTTALPDEFINAAFDMEIGELRRVDASYATHLMLRCELPPMIWNETAYASMMGDFKEYVKSEVYAEKVAPMIAEIVYDTDLMEKHTVYNTPITVY
ncbi:MAG: peptidylprolyl isomerase [Clostridia bacterium]|nr:peptidylprolyl isomerase [Clostridia bacterium]